MLKKVIEASILNGSQSKLTEACSEWKIVDAIEV